MTMPSGYASLYGMISDVSVLYSDVISPCKAKEYIVAEAFLNGEFSSPNIKEVLNVSPVFQCTNAFLTFLQIYVDNLRHLNHLSTWLHKLNSCFASIIQRFSHGKIRAIENVSQHTTLYCVDHTTDSPLGVLLRHIQRVLPSTSQLLSVQALLLTQGL